MGASADRKAERRGGCGCLTLITIIAGLVAAFVGPIAGIVAFVALAFAAWALFTKPSK